MPIVIGLTGSAGSGKSTVAKKLAALGCEVADADVIARDILIANADELRETHPGWFVDGRLSPRRVAEDSFSSADRYRELVEFLWPKTRARARQIIQESKAEYFVYDASMLFEAGAQEQCDLTILVTADDAVRKERAMARSGWTSEEFDQRTAFQMPQAQKAVFATLRLHNGGSLDELETRTERLFRELVPEALGDRDSIATLPDAWRFANRWWRGDSLDHHDAFAQIVALMDRIGYHSLSHVERMLSRYRDWLGATGEKPDPRLIGWIFAHDLVYVPGATDNESASADRMNEILLKTHAYRCIEHDDRLAIESTKTHEPIDARRLENAHRRDDIHLLHDLDLEILAADPADYERYRAGVYEEYLAAANDPAGFPEQWRQGRAAFLEGMLARERVVKTAGFAELEPLARKNMLHELSELRSEA